MLGRRATPLPTAVKRFSTPDLILVGSSTGGPAAVRTFLENIPDEYTMPIVITQHMPPVFTGVFADQLNRRLNRSVHEAKQGDILRPGGVWISPGNFHLTLSREGQTWRTHLDDRPHLHGCRPAVDHLFSSVADEIKPGMALITAVILTGMGQDGCAGAARLKQAGGTYVRILAQNKASSAVWGMPAAIVDAGLDEGTGTPQELGAMVRFEYMSKRRPL
jgi:two-component system chemotaxis response regulator CheB